MTVCPIALLVHCTGCPLVKFCPAKTILGDYGKHTQSSDKCEDESGENAAEESKEKERD